MCKISREVTYQKEVNKLENLDSLTIEATYHRRLTNCEDELFARQFPPGDHFILLLLLYRSDANNFQVEKKINIYGEFQSW